MAHFVEESFILACHSAVPAVVFLSIRKLIVDRSFAFSSAQLFKCSTALLAKGQLEAGGFEPPSRYASRRASTHLVVSWFFRLPDRQTTANRFGYSGIGLNPSARKLRREQPTSLRPNQARRRNLKGRAALFRQPFATGSCQLNLVPD